jgi:hypothetical protein
MRGGRLAVLLLAAAAISVGCDSIGEDLSDLASSLTPKTPGEAARLAANLNDADARREGIVLLSNADFGGLEIYVALYREYASIDTDPLVRAEAVRALARHGTPEDALIVASNLAHEHLQVRWEAAKGLQRLHNPAVVADMLAVLRDPAQDPDVRAALARGLGQYPEDRVFQALIAALDERELGVNLAALDSLRTLTGEDHGMDAPEWLRWYRQTFASGGDPFVGAGEFLFPTFTRDLTFFERMAFWSPVVFEQPAAPAGLAPAGSRTTYGP